MSLRSTAKIGLAITILAVVTLVFQRSILADGLVAIVVQVLAALLMIWARFTFGVRSFHATPDPIEGGLVTSGPYHYLRHPIYAAILYFLWAGVLSHVSFLNVLLGFGASIGLSMRIFAEERLVAERYPDYVEYSSRTKRIIPFIL